MISGGSTGLANCFDIDPVILRLPFVAILFFGGSRIVFHAIFHFVVPLRQPEGDVTFDETN